MIPREAFEQTLLELLAPIRELLADPAVSEIMINGPDQVFVERSGKLSLTGIRFAGEPSLLAALRNAAQFVGKCVDEASPILEGRLPDGSRLVAVIAPVVQAGPCVSIRRFSACTLTLDRLTELGSLSEAAAGFLAACVDAKHNVLVGGGAGSGKTSLLGALAEAIPASERLVVIEDCRELDLSDRHAVQLETRPGDASGQGAVTVRELFRTALRLRPDRIIIGEIRGGEALDVVQAMTSGHGGCLATLHATLPVDSLHRLETLCLMNDTGLPLPAIRSQIGSGVDLLVQTARQRDGTRCVTHVTEVVGFDVDRQRYALSDLFVRRLDRSRPGGPTRSELVPTGELPRRLDQLEQGGHRLPRAIRAAAVRSNEAP
jgi:pilus assembly protein CpaF